MEKVNFRLVLFTKYFSELSVDRLIEVIKDVEVEGADLCVRPGCPVSLEGAEKLSPVSKKFEENGLSIPMITTSVDFLDPNSPLVEKLFSSCQDAGIKLIKLGYWHMDEDGYWNTVERIRKKIEKFVKIAEKYNVKVLIHNHSGGTMGLNSCSIMNLVKGFDSKYIGVFADPGHLSIVGEPIPMAFDIVKDYLSAIAVKDILRERMLVEGKRQWNRKVVPLGEGYVDWNDVVKVLVKLNFSGPISIHSEYSGLEITDVIDQTRMDVRFFKRII